MFNCFLDEIKEGRWRIDKGLIRYLIRKGDSDARFDLLTSSLDQFLTHREREYLFLTEFKLRKNDPWSLMVLSEILHSIILQSGSVLTRANKYRAHIDFFVSHSSFTVRRFGIMSAVLLNPAERKHFVALKAGLFHSNDSMRLYAMTALGIMSNGSQPLPNSTIEIIRSVKLREALKRFSKRYEGFSGNIKALEEWFEKHRI